MRMSVAGRWLAMSSLVLLAACGGGGGGGSSSTSSLGFDPSSVTTNVQYQNSATLSVVASIRNAAAINSTVYVAVQDDQQVLVGDVQISEIDSSHFSATLHTSPSLGLGHHKGSLQVVLCKDSQCAGRWTPSPAVLPYDINVTPAPLSASHSRKVNPDSGSGSPETNPYAAIAANRRSRRIRPSCLRKS